METPHHNTGRKVELVLQSKKKKKKQKQKQKRTDRAKGTNHCHALRSKRGYFFFFLSKSTKKCSAELKKNCVRSKRGAERGADGWGQGTS